MHFVAFLLPPPRCRLQFYHLLTCLYLLVSIQLSLHLSFSSAVSYLPLHYIYAFYFIFPFIFTHKLHLFVISLIVVFRFVLWTSLFARVVCVTIFEIQPLNLFQYTSFFRFMLLLFIILIYFRINSCNIQLWPNFRAWAGWVVWFSLQADDFVTTFETSPLPPLLPNPLLSSYSSS